MTKREQVERRVARDPPLVYVSAAAAAAAAATADTTLEMCGHGREGRGVLRVRQAKRE